ncbi:hypothetical protein [Acidiferrobacter sp.]|uniref:hypothetical protein n=1 Tax=Acidiferrobacter sp. TaxID=1872107 RepID=UPI00260C8278|nr:hypothetical protein [Acidiferrobacter sp.]
MRRHTHIGLIAILIVAFAAPVGARLLSGAGGATLVVVENASSATVNTSASVTTPVNANGWRSGTIAAQSKAGNNLGVIPGATLPAQASSAAAAQALSSYLQPLLGSEAETLQAAMNGTTDEGALYTYTESIPLSAGGNAQVAGLMWVPKTGAYDWLGVNATGGTFTLLYGTYEQSQAASGLPASWTMPNAGDFLWELMQVSTANGQTLMTPIAFNGSITHTVAAGGAFDAPRLAGSVIDNCTAQAGNPLMCNQPNPFKTYPAKVNGQTVSYDPNVGYNLLISQEVAPLIKSTGASAALIDYGRTVQPVYTQSSNGTQTAVTAVAVNSRTFNGGCGASSLANSGDIGYLLDQVNSQYYVSANGTSSLLGNTTTNLISPTQSFSQSANLPSGAQYSQYVNDVVNPFGGGQVYNWQNDTVNGLPASDYVYVAPLAQAAGANTNTASSVTLPGGATVCASPTLATYAQYYSWYGPPFQGPTVVVNGQALSPSGFNAQGYPVWWYLGDYSAYYLLTEAGNTYWIYVTNYTPQSMNVFRSWGEPVPSPLTVHIYHFATNYLDSFNKTLYVP